MKEKKINYDFIEIGTSNFDTLIGSCSETSVGLSIEPPAAASPANANKGRSRFPLSNKKEVKASETGDKSDEIEFR